MRKHMKTVVALRKPPQCRGEGKGLTGESSGESRKEEMRGLSRRAF